MSERSEHVTLFISSVAMAHLPVMGMDKDKLHRSLLQDISSTWE